MGYEKEKEERPAKIILPKGIVKFALCSWVLLLTAFGSLVWILSKDVTRSMMDLPRQEDQNVHLNMRPIIGVLSQEIPTIWKEEVFNSSGCSSYIAASYVKSIESGGARVAAIPIGMDDQFYKEMFRRINGLLLPGGLVSPFNSEYQRVAQIMYKLAVQANNGGDVFPIWGTCLGFQQLAVLSTNFQNIITSCKSYGQSVPLELGDDWRKSKLFGKAPADILQYLTTLPITLNFHHDCVTADNFKRFNMSLDWLSLSYNKDLEGEVFIGTMEAKNFPFFATQWHPEKNPYEWDPVWNIDGSGHSREAMRTSFYMAEFFVDLARHSNHTFTNKISEDNALIYNNNIFYMGNKPGNLFEQVYML